MDTNATEYAGRHAATVNTRTDGGAQEQSQNAVRPPATEEKLLATVPDDEPLFGSAFSFGAYQYTSFDPPVVFAHCGASFAYRAGAQSEMFVVFDGRKSPNYFCVGVPLISPNGERIAFQANSGASRSAIVVDGITGPDIELGHTLAFAFAPNSRTFAYSLGYGTVQGRRSCMVVDGKKAPEFSQVGTPVFSPDSRFLAYTAHREEYGWRVGLIVTLDLHSGSTETLGETSPKEGTWVEVASPTFSPDSKSLAYAYRESAAGAWSLIVDGEKRGAQHEDLSSIVFSPDGKRIAFIAATKSGKKRVVLDGAEEDKWESISGLVFGPDGASVAYCAERDLDTFLILGGKKVCACDSASRPVFLGKDTIALAFRTHIAVVSHHGVVKSKSYDWVSDPVIGSDGTSVCFGAVRGKEILWIRWTPE